MAIQQPLPPPVIHRLRLRTSNCYLISHDRVVVFDTGLRGEGISILRSMARIGLAASDVTLILLSHGHLDHAGGAAQLAAATGAPVALHGADAAWLRLGQEVPAPPVTKWARIISRLLSIDLIRHRINIGEFSPDIIIGDKGFSLLEYGIPGRVLCTTGHTKGSISILLEDGRAIVGDLAMNGFPSLKFKPDLPIVAQDLSELKKSWQLLCELGATTIYPGHGLPFPAEVLRCGR